MRPGQRAGLTLLEVLAAAVLLAMLAAASAPLIQGMARVGDQAARLVAIETLAALPPEILSEAAVGGGMTLESGAWLAVEVVAEDDAAETREEERAPSDPPALPRAQVRWLRCQLWREPPRTGPPTATCYRLLAAAALAREADAADGEP